MKFMQVNLSRISGIALYVGVMLSLSLGSYAAIAQTGEVITSDLLMRWHNIQAQSPDTGKVADLLAEGERIIQRLQELESLRSNPNQPVGKSYYQRIVRLQDRFKDLLFHIEMARLSSLPTDEVKAMKADYEEERDRLAQEIVTLEDSIIYRGEIFLETYKQQISLKHYMSKQEMIVDFIYRLAEIYFRRGEDEFFTTNDVSSFKPALQKYRRIIDEFPASEYVDDALYNIAYVKNSSNREEDRLEAITLYKTLIEKYQNSNFVPEAYWRVAEHNFYQKPPNTQEAISYYSQLQRYPETSWYGRGLYKVGWCYFLEGDYPSAIDYFTQTVDISLDEELVAQDILFASMMDEALEYISICFAQDSTEWEGSGVDAAVAFVQEDSIRFNTYGRKIIEYLGDINKYQIGKYYLAIEAYKSYLALYPMDEKAPWIQDKIIECYSINLREFLPAYEGKLRLFADYRVDTEWDAANPDQELRSEADVIIEKHYFRALNENIGRAVKTNDPVQLTDCVEMSRNYLETFPQGPNAYTVNYNLAVLLDQHVTDRMAAYDEYIKVSSEYTDEQHRKEAAINAVIIAYKMIGERGDVPLDSLMGTEIGEHEQKYIDAVDNYLALFPQGEEAELFLLNAGGIYYNHGFYEDSRQYYNTLLETFPLSERRGTAYSFIMNGYFAAGQYSEAERIAKEIQAAGMDSSIVASAQTRQAESAFLGAEAMKTGGDLLAAAQEYRRTALETPDWNQADKAFFEAGLTFQQANAWTDANDAYLLMVERYPESELADKALYNVGYNTQSELGDKAFAAQTFERIALEYPESELAQDALRNASINYVEAENWNGAIGANTTYVAMFPAAIDANLFLFENAGLFLKLGDEAAANEIYSQYAQLFPDDPRVVRVRWERGTYLQDQGRQAEALAEFMAGIEAHRLLVAKGKTGEETYASRCLFEVIKSDFSIYESIDFAPANVVEARKTVKLAQRERLLQHLEELNRLAKDEMFEGLYMVGRVEEELSRAFAERVLPERGSAEEKILARETANQDAIEIAARAIDAYAKSADDLDIAVRVLRAKEAELERHKEELSIWMLEAQKADPKPSELPDSAAVLAGLDRGLEDIREGYDEGADWARRAREKVPELALRNAEIKFATVQAFLDLPDVGKNKQLKMLYRAAVLSEFVVPRSAAVIELYLQAIDKASFSADAEMWKSQAMSSLDRVFEVNKDEYKMLNERALASYARFYGIYGDLLNEGEGATTSGGLEAADIAELLVTYSDHSYNFAVASLNSQDVLLTAAEAGSEMPPDILSRFAASAIEEVFRVNDRYIGLSTEANESKANAETLQDQSVVWEDAVMTYEDCAYNFTGHQEEFLTIAMEFNRLHGNDQALALRVGWALVDLDRDTYLSLLEEYGEERWLRSDETFRVNPAYEDEWSSLGFNDAQWSEATVTNAGEGEGDLAGTLPLWTVIALDSITVAPDSLYLRKFFEINDQPVAGDLWISVDGGYSLLLNGEFVGAGEPGDGWTVAASYDISHILNTGQNTIAIMAVDPDSTTEGVRLALRYKVLPSQSTGGP